MAEKEIISENEAGLLEFTDPETGEIKGIQKPQRRAAAKIAKGEPIKVKKEYDIIESEGGKMIADPETVPRKGKQNTLTVHPYNETTAGAIIEYVCEGKTLRQISSMKNIPPVSTIHYWASKYAAFKQALVNAKKVRGEQFADEAVDVARKTTSMTSRKDKLKIDTLKWAASVNNPEEFGNAVTHKGDASHPITILVDTGIRRNDDK